MTQASYEERLGAEDLAEVRAALEELSRLIGGLIVAGDIDMALKRIRWMVAPFLARMEALPGLGAAQRYARIAGQDAKMIDKTIAAAADEMRLYVDAIAQFNPIMIGPHTVHLPPQIPSWAFEFERFSRGLGREFLVSVFGSEERYWSLCQQKSYLPRRR